MLRLFFILFLLFCSLPCAASAKTYTMTEAELVRLETNLTQPEEINRASQTATRLALELKASRKESERLSEQLKALEKVSETQRQLLANANQSLAKYAREEKKKNRLIKGQRLLAYILLAEVVVLGVSSQ